MIEVKEAIANAVGFLSDMLGDEGVQDIRLEEVELSENTELWHITLSFTRRSKVRGTVVSETIQSVLGAEREYKVLEVRSRDGHVNSMKIREISQPA